MTEQDLKYVVSVLKDEKTNGVPDWYAVLGFLSCHRIAGLFYKHAQKCGLELPKKAEKIEENRYHIMVDYDKDDETEMVIRILSFGPMIKVVQPEHFINLIKERLRKQKSWER